MLQLGETHGLRTRRDPPPYLTSFHGGMIVQMILPYFALGAEEPGGRDVATVEPIPTHAGVYRILSRAFARLWTISPVNTPQKATSGSTRGVSVTAHMQESVKTRRIGGPRSGTVQCSVAGCTSRSESVGAAQTVEGSRSRNRFKD